jgi:hypothetical protein
MCYDGKNIEGMQIYVTWLLDQIDNY